MPSAAGFADHFFGKIFQNRLVGDVKQHALCLIVVLHRLVIVKMILREIRKDRNLKMRRAYALLHESERADLHHNRITARIRHSAVESEQLKRHGRGIVGVNDLVTDFILNRADESHLVPVFRENILDDRGDGRLAVGAGYADEAHFLFRMSEPCGTEIAIFCAGIGNKQLLFAQSQIPLDDDGSCAVFECPGCGGMAVKFFAPDCHENAARCNFPVVVRNRRDFGVTNRGLNSVFQ